MLVLSRKRDEEIVVGDDIFITVKEIRGNRVRLGFEAPREMPVFRREKFDEILKAGGEIVSNASGKNGTLVLSRSQDESVVLGSEIEIFVVEIRGDKVRIGIEAPKHIPVHRREVYDAIKREKQRAANPGPPSGEKPVSRGKQSLSAITAGPIQAFISKGLQG